MREHERGPGRLEELSDSDAGLTPGEGDGEGRKVGKLSGHVLDCSTVLGKVQQSHQGSTKAVCQRTPESPGMSCFHTPAVLVTG